ncbi:MAG: ABC transporter permease [Candidatus Pacebacteria bacterium]|nr:ABC transporter permease [Candidatus Paceibacterota bacterium]
MKKLFIINSKRVTVTAFKDLVRNVWLNLATIIIIVIALFTITTMLAIDKVGNHALLSLQNQIDISVQFKGDANEEKILEFKKDLEQREEINAVEYISKEQALITFQDAHREEGFIEESIEELGENPLFAILNIKANEISQYGIINEYIINNNNYKDIVEKVNYKKNEKALNTLSGMLKSVKDGIMVLTILFVLISILIVFNTIRLAMYSHKKEIEIMRLVGASNWYIRMPFIIEGAILGLVGCVLTLAIISPAAVYISPRIMVILPEFDLYWYFMNNFVNVSLLLLLVASGMGIFGSFVAIRRYLKG